MVYKILVRMIEQGNYNTKEEMEEKVSILMLNRQITMDQYNELMNMLNKEQ